MQRKKYTALFTLFLFTWSLFFLAGCPQDTSTKKADTNKKWSEKQQVGLRIQKLLVENKKIKKYLEETEKRYEKDRRNFSKKLNQLRSKGFHTSDKFKSKYIALSKHIQQREQKLIHRIMKANREKNKQQKQNVLKHIKKYNKMRKKVNEYVQKAKKLAKDAKDAKDAKSKLINLKREMDKQIALSQKKQTDLKEKIKKKEKELKKQKDPKKREKIQKEINNLQQELEDEKSKEKSLAMVAAAIAIAIGLNPIIILAIFVSLFGSSAPKGKGGGQKLSKTKRPKSSKNSKKPKKQKQTKKINLPKRTHTTRTSKSSLPLQKTHLSGLMGIKNQVISINKKQLQIRGKTYGIVSEKLRVQVQKHIRQWLLITCEDKTKCYVLNRKTKKCRQWKFLESSWKNAGRIGAAKCNLGKKR